MKNYLDEPQTLGKLDLALLIEAAFIPVDDECSGCCVRRYRGQEVRRDWRKSELALRSKFPGLVLSYEAREQLKYKAPANDALLEDWIIAFLRTARAHWACAVVLEGRRCQFDTFMVKSLREENWFQRFAGRWTDAAELVRELSEGR